MDANEEKEPFDEEDDEEEEDEDFAEEDAENSDEDPVAEGDAIPAQDIEPSYEKANSLPFFTLCRRLEGLWKATRGRIKKKNVKLERADKLRAILPETLLNYLSTPLVPGGPPESAFPLIRLLIPDKDASRYFNAKENTIAMTYAGAFQLSKRPGGPYEMLAHYREPNIVNDPAAVGDFALVVKKVLKDRIVHDKTEKSGSDWTVGDINHFLDELANLKHKSVAAKATQGANAKSLKDLRIELFRELSKPRSKDGAPLSPLEHCWLVRIIQQDMKFGVGWRNLLEWFNKHAAALYDAHTSLKAICKTLCLPDFVGNHGQENAETDADKPTTSYIISSNVSLTFGRPFKPMLSAKTSFEKCLDDISNRHRVFVNKLPDDHPLHQSLTFRNPVFSVETKLDGERMIVHASRDGAIKIHSRVGNWYSDLYSPVLGPSLRQALAGNVIDVVFDGEILAYDAGRKETIPFGQNRTVANLRRQWMQRSNMVDERDTLRHDADKHDNIITTNHVANRMHMSSDADLAGEECWLQFVAFDILYINGPDASRLLEETVSSHIVPRPEPGAITSLDGIERKRLLYRVLQQQENEVQIVATWVIRPDGELVEGSDYFRFDDPLCDFGYLKTDLDSLSWTLSQDKATILNLEQKRRHCLRNSSVSEARASAVNEIYGKMVEDQRMEGLVFKDLSCPYYLGDESRNLAYWHKFKPDYHNGSSASDLDLVIIGAYFASGLRLAGMPSSFLCACVDSKDPEVFFPLCKVNAGSMRQEVLHDLFKSTGFTKNGETGKYDVGQKWFKEQGRNIPDFVTTRTYQPSVHSGWKVRSADYPDLWIHPSDSRIITLNAGEIVSSDAFSAGVTLRFPRVTALRDDSEKNVSDVETEFQLWSIYQETLATRSDVVTGITFSSPANNGNAARNILCRFLTEEQLNESKKKKTKSRTKREMPRVDIADLVEKVESDRLTGMVIFVLEGTYFLDENFIYEDEAKEAGWLEEAKKIRSSQDLQLFIRKHSGTVYSNADTKALVAADGRSLVVGGRKDDARVVSHVQAIKNYRSEVESWHGKKPKTKRAGDVELLAARKGVVRWSYLFSLVYGSRSADPKFMDYLVFASPGGDPTNYLLTAVCTEEIQSATYLQRVLAALSDSRTTRPKLLSWQDQAERFLDPSERWIVASKYQTLWPYRKSEAIVKRSEVFYIARGNDGMVDENLLSSSSAGTTYESLLPLVRVMGARASFKLSTDVTYVICDLVEGGDIAFTYDLSPSIFSDAETGIKLLSTLKNFCMQHEKDDIRLISPSTIRKRKWCDAD